MEAIVKDKGEEVDENTTVSNEDTAVDIAVEEVQANHPPHLFPAERELLSSCAHNTNFRKKTGKMDWSKVEKVFKEKADNICIFPRSKKRLRSTQKRSLSLDNNTNNDVPNTSHDNSNNLRDSHMNSINNVPSTTNDSANVVLHDLSLSDVTHLNTERRRVRVGKLDASEREFVKNYGQERLLLKMNVDNDAMSEEYKSAFPGYTRDGDALKRTWINYKKDSLAYREFLRNNSIKK